VGTGEIRELLDGKIWEWDLSFRWEWDGMRMGMKSFKWEGIGTKNLFPHTSTADHLPVIYRRSAVVQARRRLPKRARLYAAVELSLTNRRRRVT